MTAGSIIQDRILFLAVVQPIIGVIKTWKDAYLLQLSGGYEVKLLSGYAPQPALLGGATN